MRLSFNSNPDLVIMGSWLGVLTGILAIPTTLLAIRVVRHIHDRQERKAAGSSQQPASSEFPAQPDTGVPGGGDF